MPQRPDEDGDRRSAIGDQAWCPRASSSGVVVGSRVDRSRCSVNASSGRSQSRASADGKTIRQRAQALIDIAHPKFREELYKICETTKWLQRPAAEEIATTAR